jgi:seryl-tRNA synthetase
MSGEQLTLINCESLINTSCVRYDEIKKQTKDLKSQLDSILENDAEYQDLCDQVNKLNNLKKIAKQKVMQREEVKSLDEKIKDGNHQVKEIKVALSDYLAQYVILSGTNQIEMADGVIRQIIYSAKLVKFQ